MRSLRCILALALGAWLLGAGVVVAQGGVAERIRDFSVDARIRTDATVEIVETIAYDFGSTERHGIYREIPVRYTTKLGKQSISISGVTVTDAAGAPYPFTVSRVSGFERVKIGDPDIVVSGLRTYVIRYVADRAIGYFDDHDELYWNVTGNGWEVPIDAASARLHLPPTDSGGLTASCYEGFGGSPESCGAAVASTVTREETGILAEFRATRELEAGEGLTVALGFPKGIVRQPTGWENALQLVTDNGILALPLAVFALMFTIWYRKGRDPKGRGTIVPQYEAPENLAPVELSAILHQKAKTADLSAEIIYLATKGMLTVARIPAKGIFSGGDDYQFTKTGNDGKLPPFDSTLLQSIFGSKQETKLSDLKEKFHRHIQPIVRQVGESVVTKGYYPVSPGKVMLPYFGAAFLCITVPIVLGVPNYSILGAMVLSGIIIAAFGYHMPKVTPKGAEAREAILGLKEYLQIAEKDRINFHNAPKKEPKRFEALLPYAMVLGVEKAWAKEFEGIYTTPPSWYSDPSGGVFSAVFLANSLHGFSASAASTLVSAPHGGSGAGGGGFSGGGFGGGGGGSW